MTMKFAVIIMYTAVGPGREVELRPRGAEERGFVRERVPKRRGGRPEVGCVHYTAGQ